jgi:hypothetical protein
MDNLTATERAALVWFNGLSLEEQRRQLDWMRCQVGWTVGLPAGSPLAVGRDGGRRKVTGPLDPARIWTD